MSIPKDVQNIASGGRAAFEELIRNLKGQGGGVLPESPRFVNTRAESLGPLEGVEGAAGGGAVAQEGLMSLIKSRNWKGVLKHPGGIVAGLMLAQFLYNSMKGKIGAARDMGMEEDFIGQQAGMSEEDAYYQAALPGLTQERQQAQDALLQAIMGGRGQKIQVPGERQI